MRITARELERELNEIGPSDHDTAELGGRVPAAMSDRYGTWLRREDPIAFQVALNEARREGAKR